MAPGSRGQPQNATGLAFTEALPNGVTFVSATATQGSCEQSIGTVTCTIGSLRSGFGAGVAVAATLNPTKTAETLTSGMQVSANEPDLALTNNSATPSAGVFTLTYLRAAQDPER